MVLVLLLLRLKLLKDLALLHQEDLLLPDYQVGVVEFGLKPSYLLVQILDLFGF
jgi:hypothetical protein